MDKQANVGLVSDPLVSILIGGLEKALGPSYRKVIATTPWERYLSKPPSSDPTVIEATDDEWAMVCAEIYRQVGKDLFISFGRYAGIESSRLFTTALARQVTPTLEGLEGVERLQRAAAMHTAALNTQTDTISIKNTDDGVLVTVRPCSMCSLIKSNEPICAYITEGLHNSYGALTGLRVGVKEIKCQAMGAIDYCAFNVTTS